MITTSNIAFQLLALGVLGGYFWLLWNFRSQAAECLKITATFAQVEGAESRRAYNSFVASALTLGALSLGLAAVKVVASTLTEIDVKGSPAWMAANLAGTRSIAEIAHWVAPAAALAVAGLAAAVGEFAKMVLRTAGRLTLSENFTAAVIQTKQNWLAAAALLLIPLAAVWTGVNPVRDLTVGYMAGFVAITTAVAYAVHTLAGFVRQKVSLLVWFLYLCTVEIFPVSALVLLGMKNL